jgi:excinuclease ABC subunit C
MYEIQHSKPGLFSNLPDNPGCYIFKDSSGQEIYIGKAKNLKKRVNSYFQKKGLDPKTQKLVESIESIDFIVTDNEVEALILENNLIKKHTPKYNINLKDQKNYAYIHVTDELFPRLIISRNTKGKGEFFGPFVSAATRDHILYTLRRVFQLRTCKRMPKKTCLRYHINLCRAPCIKNIGEPEYAGKIRRIKMVLKGKIKELIEGLSEEMKKASEDLNFEHAMELRNQIEALKVLKERQKMDRQKKYNEDIINYIIKDNKVYLILFNLYKGILENKQEFQFDYYDGFFEEFLLRFYSDKEIPTEMIVPTSIDESLISFFSLKANKSVKVRIPQKGEKKHLMELVLKNIEISFFGDIKKLEDLRDKLGLQELPTVIECFDISHLSGTSTVASMVQFRNALPDKNNYRRFRIKTLEGIDDVGSIAEVVKRRYSRLINEQADLPDLVMIDGGLGQLNAALKELKKLELKIPTISIAKKFEEVFIPGAGEPLRMSRKSKALQLLQLVRDEAHRFAISYNRLLRQKEFLK